MQPPAIFTLKLPVPPAPETVVLVGVRVAVQDALCVMLKIFVPTVIVPLRVAPVFAATVKLTIPFPFPLLVVVIQLAPGVADHAQPAVVVTLKEPFPPLAAKVALVGLIVN